MPKITVIMFMGTFWLLYSRGAAGDLNLATPYLIFSFFNFKFGSLNRESQFQVCKNTDINL